MSSSAPEGRYGPAPSDAGPSALSLPDPLPLPGALATPASPRDHVTGPLSTPGSMDLNLYSLGLPDPLHGPGPLSLPDALPTPSITVDSDLPGRPEAPGMGTADAQVPRTAQAYSRNMWGHPSGASTGPSEDSSREVLADEDGEDAPQSRRRLSKRCVLLPLLAVAAIVLSDDDEQEPQSTSRVPAAASTAARSPRAAVGMPIPGGNAPVQPVRLVINTTASDLPPREQRELARWIANTQHPMTRVRLRRDGRLSTVLDAGALETATPARTRGSGRAWLRKAQTKGIAAGQINVGNPPGGAVNGSSFRTLSVAVTANDRRTTRATAAKVAQQIMDVSRQRNVGTTTP